MNRGTTPNCLYIPGHEPGYDRNCYWCAHAKQNGLRQKVTAVVRTTVAVDANEIRKQLETLCIQVVSVRVEKVE